MRFRNLDLSYTEMKITKYTPDIKINYKLIQLSNSNYASIDRGSTTDRYSTTMTFRGRTSTIQSLVNELTLLRTSNEQIVIDEFKENVFGDNVDHSGVINCIVYSFGKETSPVMNVQELTITFLPTDIITLGNPVLPSLDCLSHRWSGFADWNTHVNETYNRNNYFVDRGADTYTFEGTYGLTIDENKDLLAFWKTQRGNSFNINDGDFGVNRMFGGYINSATYDVIITDISYTRVSPTRRSTKITLVKAG